MGIPGLRWLTFAVWAGVGASAIFWGLRLTAAGPSMPPGAMVVASGAGPQGDPTRLLGAATVAPVATAALPAASSRFTLVGVVSPLAPAAQAEGLAVISVDDAPPRAFRVGATVDGDLVVRRVHARGVELGSARGGAAFSLDAPPLTTGVAGAPALPSPGLPVPRPFIPPRPVALPAPMAGGVEGFSPQPEIVDTEPETQQDTLPTAVPVRGGLETR